jgi:hypothetical protein
MRLSELSAFILRKKLKVSMKICVLIILLPDKSTQAQTINFDMPGCIYAGLGAAPDSGTLWSSVDHQRTIGA